MSSRINPLYLSLVTRIIPFLSGYPFGVVLRRLLLSVLFSETTGFLSIAASSDFMPSSLKTSLLVSSALTVVADNKIMDAINIIFFICRYRFGGHLYYMDFNVFIDITSFLSLFCNCNYSG